MVSPEDLKRVYDEHAGAAFDLFLNFACHDADARDLLQDWLVIVSLWIATPDAKSPSAGDGSAARLAVFDAESYPMLAWRFGGISENEPQLLP